MLKLPPGDGTWRAKHKWMFAVYKPQSKAKPYPRWEESWTRFQDKREHISAIAMGQANGKPVTTQTIGRHVLTALQHAKPVDLGRLYEQLGTNLPTEAEWRRLDEVEALSGARVADVEKFDRKDYLRQILGAELVDVEYADKGDAQRVKESAWYSVMDTWWTLKVVGFAPQFV